MAMGCECGPLKMQRTCVSKDSRLYIFWLSDPRSHRVHREANTIKRGPGSDDGLTAQVLRDIAPTKKPKFHICPHCNTSSRTHRDTLDIATPKP